MSDEHARKEYLERLRGWRNPPPRDLTLRFLAEVFKREVAKPHKQMGEVAEAWQRLVPAPLVSQTALAGLTRGTLTVHVADSAVLYELDRLMRSGLERQIQTACKAQIKRIRLTVRNL